MSNIVKLREILVYNQPKQKHYKFQTATDKWSELAELIKNQPELEVDNLNNMRAVVQSTENTLELPNALIPDGPQKIFLFEAKVKSGVDYERMSYNDLRRLAKKKDITGLGSNPEKGALVDALENSAGITKQKISKTSLKGRVTTKTVKTESKDTPKIKAKDKELLKIQIGLSERQAALELGFEKLITGLYEICSDFVKPKFESEIKENISISELNKEASKLKV